MRNIYLHIGCGKTGSSALQIWFSQTADTLRTHGIIYPQDRKIDSSYEITSGNGGSAVESIQAGNAKNFFEKLLANNPAGDLLLSSESFQILSSEQIIELRSILDEYKLNPVVIAYVRNLYDFAWSAYNQMVKRHGCGISFKDFAFSNVWRPLIRQHLDVLDAFASHFNVIRVIHYDSEKSRLDLAFLEAIGLNSASIPRMRSAIVNRSLSLFELELMRRLNGVIASRFNTENLSRISMAISDALIYADPERKTEFYYDEEVAAHLEQVLGGRLSKFNDRFFPHGGGLKIIDEHKRHSKPPEIEFDQAYLIALDKLFEMMELTGTEAVHAESQSIGYLDGVRGRTVFGWARLAHSHAPAEVMLYVNDQLIATVKADKPRPDLKEKFGRDCAFVYDLPEEIVLKPGDRLRARVVNEVRDLNNSPIEIRAE